MPGRVLQRPLHAGNHRALGSIPPAPGPRCQRACCAHNSTPALCGPGRPAASSQPAPATGVASPMLPMRPTTQPLTPSTHTDKSGCRNRSAPRGPSWPASCWEVVVVQVEPQEPEQLQPHRPLLLDFGPSPHCPPVPQVLQEDGIEVPTQLGALLVKVGVAIQSDLLARAQHADRSPRVVLPIHRHRRPRRQCANAARDARGRAQTAPLRSTMAPHIDHRRHRSATQGWPQPSTDEANTIHRATTTPCVAGIAYAPPTHTLTHPRIQGMRHDSAQAMPSPRRPTSILGAHGSRWSARWVIHLADPTSL